MILVTLVPAIARPIYIWMNAEQEDEEEQALLRKRRTTKVMTVALAVVVIVVAWEGMKLLR
ncbi:MAG TPA: hypothetical protein GX499_02945 [Clostridiales bacterium]|nr:hypothetical protein [Clostridiales bacterium]